MVATSSPFCRVMCLALLGPGAAWAVDVTVTVTDMTGRLLPDAVVSLEPASGRLPAKPMPTAEISQAQRQFSPRVTVITTGTAVTFPNHDTVRHHVYSFSPAKTFELKLYAGVPNVPVVFDKPGVAVLGCNIHDQMSAWVVVVDSPFHARTAESGQARVASVPAGAYRIRTWHPGLAPGAEPATTALTVGAAEVSASVRIAATAAP